MIKILDYGLGNIGSILNMLKKVGVKASVASTAEELDDADKIILPGVGHFDRAMEHINRSGIKEKLEEKVLLKKTPILGICLGMQLLTRGSEEGTLPGFGWIPAYTYRFKISDNSNIKVPHMGWNVATPAVKSVMNSNFNEEIRFYFVHSYYVKTDDSSNSMFKTFHGVEFDSGIHKDNIFGVQFHPEKSHRFGIQIFKNFVSI